MDSAWDNVHARFMEQLLNKRVDDMIESPEWLKKMRYNNKEVKFWLKRAGHIFEERGLNLYELIAKACGECWDTEDEQKTAEGSSPPLWENNGATNDEPRNSTALWEARADSPQNCVLPKVKEETQTCPQPGSLTSSLFTPQEKRRIPPTSTGRR